MPPIIYYDVDYSTHVGSLILRGIDRSNWQLEFQVSKGECSWKDPIRLTLIWDSTSNQYVDLVATLKIFNYESENKMFLDEF
jgi:hypothetical protein